MTIRTDLKKKDILPNSLVIGEKYIVNLTPVWFGVSYFFSCLLLITGAVCMGSGISYADTRNSADHQKDYIALQKADSKSMDIIKARLEREDAEASKRWQASPFPPAGLIVGGLVMSFCGFGIGWITIYKHNFE